MMRNMNDVQYMIAHGTEKVKAIGLGTFRLPFEPALGEVSLLQMLFGALILVSLATLDGNTS